MSLQPRLNPHVDSITPYQPGKPIEDVARELGLDPEIIIKIASNECPLGPSPKAVKAMKNSARGMHIYPDGGAYAIRRKLSEKLSVQPDQLIFGNGSNELIEFIGHCLLKPGTSAVMSQYAFVVYKLISLMFGAEPIEVPTKAGYTHDLRKMAKAIRPDTSVVFVCNPNNPTGSMVKQADIDAFMAKVPKDVLVVFDEAYYELCLKRMPDTLKYVREGRNVIVLRTFSKAYGLAGLRLGYGIAKPEIIKALEKPRQPFNVNAMAQDAGIAALDDQAFVKRVLRTCRRGAKSIVKFCRDNKLEFVPPCANFILIKVGDGGKVFNELQKLGVIVRPMGPYKLPEWIRVTFGNDSENERFIVALKKVLSK